MILNFKRILMLIAFVNAMQTLSMEKPPKKFDQQATHKLRQFIVSYQPAIHTEESFIGEVQALIAQNADPDARDHYGNTVLQVSVRLGYVEGAKLLIKAGADPNQQTGNGLRLMHLVINILREPAPQPKRLEILRLLLDSKADMYLMGDVSPLFKCNPVIAAFKVSDRDALEIMLSRFADTATTPLHTALVSNTTAEIIYLILRRFPNSINTGDSIGAAPLHLAAFLGSPFVRILLNAGAQVNVQDMTGQTPLHWAMKNERALEAISILLAAGADLTIVDQDKETPLQVAEKNGLLEKVRHHVEIYLAELKQLQMRLQ